MADQMSSALNNEVKAQRPAPPPKWLSIAKDRTKKAWQDIGDRERTVLQEAMNQEMMDPSISKRDKILLLMRTNEEGDHRDSEHSCSAYTPCRVRFPQNWSEYYHYYWKIALCCRNTMTALYILDDRQFFPYVHAMDIETWLWRQWFRPYTTEIELNRSFVQIFALDYETSNVKGSDIRSDDLISLHCDMCEQSERFKEAICATSKGPDLPPSMSGPLRGLPWPVPRYERSEMCGYTFIQPLFRALFMVLVYPKEQMPSAKDSRWVAQAQVQLVLTGITDGLSAPICFDEIRARSTGNSSAPGSQTITTTLDIATKFILHLEKREVAAFGIQPDICSIHPTPPFLLRYREDAKKLGWDEERDGCLDDLSPRSSEWVDQNLFPKWLGQGALQTMSYALLPREYGRFQEPEQYTKDWWWDHRALPELQTNRRRSWIDLFQDISAGTEKKKSCQRVE